MQSVWKFPVEAIQIQRLEVPKGSKVLSVDTQGEGVVVYALVSPAQTEKEYKEIRIYGTGHTIADDIDECTFLGTVKLQEETLVFHVFYK